MNLTLLLTQLLPLLVFIAVDALVADVRFAILAAVVFAVGQLAVTWATTRQFDWFVLLDVGLIAALGGVSIAFQNDLFFKVKPAIIEVVTIAFMLGLVLGPDRFLAGYLGRLTPGMELRPEALGTMKSILGWMCVYTALHVAAVLYTAFYSSRKVWAFVSGPGFYLVFVPIMGVVLGKALRARRIARRSAAAGSAPTIHAGPGPG